MPEIADGSVEIVDVAREAGHRTKIAVRTTVDGLNAKGACIGPMGQRVRNVVAELHGEKIDIIDWADDPATYVGNALSPGPRARQRGRRPGHAAGPVVVPDFQLSLAIGREGQNARLAARLTGPASTSTATPRPTARPPPAASGESPADARGVDSTMAVASSTASDARRIRRLQCQARSARASDAGSGSRLPSCSASSWRRMRSAWQHTETVLRRPGARATSSAAGLLPCPSYPTRDSASPVGARGYILTFDA